MTAAGETSPPMEYPNFCKAVSKLNIITISGIENNYLRIWNTLTFANYFQMKQGNFYAILVITFKKL